MAPVENMRFVIKGILTRFRSIATVDILWVVTILLFSVEIQSSWTFLFYSNIIPTVDKFTTIFTYELSSRLSTVLQ